MRSVQLFRKRNATRVFRSFWDSSRTQKYGRSKINEKEQECIPQDPYELNFRFTDCDQVTKVTVIGAAGRVGKTLSLLLKTCPMIDHLCLFDTDKAVKGVGVDISHIDTKCNVSYVCGMRNIKQALDAPDVVIIAAGCPSSPHLSGRKLFEKNAPVVASLSEACARFCPKACIILITSPINSLLPVVGGVFEIIANRIPSRKLFGLTTLDVVRANTFVAEAVRKNPNSMIVPVIGGTSQETLVPVISQMKPYCKIKRGEMVALTECLKRAEENLVDCQNCGTRGASSLSTAYAGFRFTTSLIMALKGAENIVECAFVKSDVIPELEYLASPLKLGARGIEYNFGYPPLSDYEVNLMEQAAPALISDIEMGKWYVAEQRKKKRQLFRGCYAKSFDNCYVKNSALDNIYCNLQSLPKLSKCRRKAPKIKPKPKPKPKPCLTEIESKENDEPCLKKEDKESDEECESHRSSKMEERDSDNECESPCSSKTEERDSDNECVPRRSSKTEERDSDNECEPHRSSKMEERDGDNECVPRRSSKMEERDSDYEREPRRSSKMEEKDSDYECESPCSNQTEDEKSDKESEPPCSSQTHDKKSDEECEPPRSSRTKEKQNGIQCESPCSSKMEEKESHKECESPSSSKTEETESHKECESPCSSKSEKKESVKTCDPCSTKTDEKEKVRERKHLFIKAVDKENDDSTENVENVTLSTNFQKRILISLPIVTNEGSKKLVLKNMWVSQKEEDNWEKMAEEQAFRQIKSIVKVDKPEMWRRRSNNNKKGLCLSIDVGAMVPKKRQSTDNT